MPDLIKSEQRGSETKQIGESPPLNLPKIGYSIKETLSLLPIGRTTLYGLIKAGQIEAMKINGRTMITANAIERYVASLPPLKTRIVPRRP